MRITDRVNFAFKEAEKVRPTAFEVADANVDRLAKALPENPSFDEMAELAHAMQFAEFTAMADIGSVADKAVKFMVSLLRGPL